MRAHVAGILEYLSHSSLLTVIVKPNARMTEITAWDGKEARVALAASPTDNEANTELTSFFAKLTKKHVQVKSGRASRKKILQFFDRE